MIYYLYYALTAWLFLRQHEYIHIYIIKNLEYHYLTWFPISSFFWPHGLEDHLPIPHGKLTRVALLNKQSAPINWQILGPDCRASFPRHHQGYWWASCHRKYEPLVSLWSHRNHLYAPEIWGEAIWSLWKKCNLSWAVCSILQWIFYDKMGISRGILYMWMWP